MFKWFLNLDLELKIQVITIISTTLLSILSIAIAVATLIQNNKAIKSSSRAYIVFSLDFIHISERRHKYIIIKNYGNSAATIKSISTSRAVDFCKGLNPFSKLANTVLAPTQSIATYCDFKNSLEPITFYITYSDSISTYTEQYVINPESFKEVVITKTSQHGYSNTENLIIQVSEEFIRSKF